MTNKKGYRNNYETLVHIEDVTNETEFEGQEIPYRLSEFQRLFSGVPTENIYWDPYDDGHYLVDAGNGLMFYLEAVISTIPLIHWQYLKAIIAIS